MVWHIAVAVSSFHLTDTEVPLRQALRNEWHARTLTISDEPWDKIQSNNSPSSKLFVKMFPLWMREKLPYPLSSNNASRLQQRQKKYIKRIEKQIMLDMYNSSHS